MRVKRAMVLGIEAIEALPASPEGGLDHCAHCGKGSQINRYNIIQYGFIEDKCTELYICPYCEQWTAVNYRVEVKITPEGIKYLESSDNNGR